MCKYAQSNNKDTRMLYLEIILVSSESTFSKCCVFFESFCSWKLLMLDDTKRKCNFFSNFIPWKKQHTNSTVGSCLLKNLLLTFQHSPGKRLQWNSFSLNSITHEFILKKFFSDGFYVRDLLKLDGCFRVENYKKWMKKKKVLPRKKNVVKFRELINKDELSFSYLFQILMKKVFTTFHL